MERRQGKIKEVSCRRPSYVYNPHTKRKKVAQLIGRKCLVCCKMNNCKTQALWDTGAQVSIMSEIWRSEYLPDSKVHPISDLLSKDEPLDLRAANGSDQGWIKVHLSLYDPKGKTTGSDEVLVPVLVSHDIMQKPIIGFNAIEEITHGQCQASDRVALLRNSLRVEMGKVEALLNLIQTTTCDNVIYPVKMGRTVTVVPGGQIHCISCLVKTDLRVKTEMLFEPEENLALD